MLHENAKQQQERPVYKLTLKRDKERDDVWRLDCSIESHSTNSDKNTVLDDIFWGFGLPHRMLEVAALKAKTSQERPCDDAILLQIGFSQKDLVLGLIWNDTLMGFGVLSMRQVSQNNKNERSQRRTQCNTQCLGIRIAALKAKTSQKPCDDAIFFEPIFFQ